MFTAANVGFYATWLSAAAFLVASYFAFVEGKWLLVGMYFGLFLANGCIALMAQRAV
jgi:hypothetical protein